MKSYLVFFVALAMSLQLFAQKQDITIDDLYKNYTFYAKSVYGLNSMNDGLHYSTLENQGTAIVKYSYKTGEVIDTILNVKKLDEDSLKNIVDYQFNDSETKIVFYTNRERIYRRSFFADYYVYNLEQNVLTKVSEKGRERLATLSPDGKYIAYLRDNNLFVLTIETGDVEQITTDGEWNQIINGAPDWVYEEEFGYNQAFYWSPSGKKIAYCKFDEREVKKFALLKYKGLRPEIEANRLYPEVYDFKYPKAGEDNSVVSVHSYDMDTKSTLTFNTGENTDVYFPRAFWTKQENTLAIVKLNRLQNEMDILYGDANSGETSVVYNEKNKYYIDQPTYENITFIDENQFLFMSEMDGWNHFYVYNTDKKTTEKVTDGDFDVVSYYGFDPKKNTVYYSSTEEGAIYRTVYSIRTNGKKKTKLTEQRGSNSADFSKGFKYYVNYYSNSNQPTLVTLHNEKGEQIRVLEDNAALQDTLESYKIGKKTFFNFETSEGFMLNGWMVKPYDFDASKEYPVIMTQYSGPNSQQVLDRWGIDWGQVLAARGFVVVCVDGRGTGGRGEEFRKLTYKELGKYETIDQIETAKHLGNLDFIDKNRIGIYGWSYGGFMALNCMTQGADYFNTGIAVAPVTNWRYYDNIYTERFMQKPQDNADGYDNNSPINHVEKLKGNLLIVHGLADDNVHPQNTFEITEALVQADKQFDMAIYTNRNHSIYGGNTRVHLFTKMVNYFVDNLKNTK
ncbi:MAG: DPP IV N-terminal domain-containing protein [Salinivirgaceae bacterium]|jgi:dipeptidyl-peptidase-4|nr:DPP IV N-terminal domain-containing protein [Salinivirgaceae bacterium]